MPEKIRNLADDPVLDIDEVAKQVKRHKGSIFRDMREDAKAKAEGKEPPHGFPVPFRLSANRLAWYQSDISKYVANRAATPRVARPLAMLARHAARKAVA
jgi:predicted DNA-binding transcriptional regulator AlpA